MYQPSRGESSPDNGSRGYRRRGRRWDDEDKGNNEFANSDIGSSRDRSRSRERDTVDSRRNQRCNPGEAKYTPGQKSNWSDSSSDEDMSSKSSSRKYERYPRYSRENISGQKDYYDTLGNEAFDSTNEFRNQIPLNLSGSVQKTDSQGMISKFSMQMKAPSTSGGISIKLGSVSKPKSTCSSTSTLLKSTKVAAVFNADDDDEPEEMPAECKMRMKNVGRETPTSAGPNSFGKTKIGFCNITHITEKKWEEETSNKK